MDIILALILLGIAGGIVWYLLRAKRRGDKCIGCPYAKNCESGCGEKENKKTIDN